MKISVFGSGYVGLVTGTCFAEMGNEVVCADVDARKIALLQGGGCPIFEPGLTELIGSNLHQGRLSFTTDLAAAVARADLLFIAVGTPPGEDGSADIRAVLSVADTIGRHMRGHRTVVIKSTVPVGTGAKVRATLEAATAGRPDCSFDVVSNPEFLKEGTAIADCLKPDRVVIGCEGRRAHETMAALYEPFLKSGSPLLSMDVLSSEMTKYAANAMLATKISFVNELSRLCDRVGADVEKIRQGIATDHRIGKHFIYAGLGYGGSCFPKDVRALIQTAEAHDENFAMLRAVESTNQMQRDRFFGKIQHHFGRALEGRKIAVWGLAFKPDTDDVREAPALELIERLADAGASVSAYDPVARKNAEGFFANHARVSFSDDQYQVVHNADALCLVTEWKQFREPSFERLKALMRTFVIFDGRNIYSPAGIKAAGGTCYFVGRPHVSA